MNRGVSPDPDVARQNAFLTVLVIEQVSVPSSDNNMTAPTVADALLGLTSVHFVTVGAAGIELQLHVILSHVAFGSIVPRAE